MSDTLPTLGKFLQGNEQRDAVHIAVAPVIADEELVPGAHIGFIKEGDTQLVSTHAGSYLGIVDPFLEEAVPKGKSCWMFLYPQTITSLHHLWTHPAFGTPESEAERHLDWLRAWCRNNGEVWADFEGDLKQYLARGYMSRSTGLTVPDEFWWHYQAATGNKVPVKLQTNYFSCAC